MGINFKLLREISGKIDRLDGQKSVLARRQLLKKEPIAGKNTEEREASPWGSGRINSDHHPKAVILSLGRAYPGDIGQGRRLSFNVRCQKNSFPQ